MVNCIRLCALRGEVYSTFYGEAIAASATKINKRVEEKKRRRSFALTLYSKQFYVQI